MGRNDSIPPERAHPWQATVDELTRGVLEALCAVTEDRTLPPEARAAAAQQLREAHGEGRLPDDLVARMNTSGSRAN